MRELRLHGRAPKWYVVAVAPDGRQVAAVDAKGTVAAVWDAAEGRVLAEQPLSGSSWPSIAFSADGRWLAASGGGAVEILDAATWRRAAALGEQIRAIAWDPAGPRLLAGGAAGDAAIWTVPGGARQPPHELGEVVTAVAFSPDGRRAAIGGEDGAEQVFDTGGRIISQGNYLRARIASIVFNAAGARVAAAGASGELAIGDATSGLPVEILGGPQQQLRDAWFDASGHRVLAASADGTARVWSSNSPYRQWSAAPIGTGYGLFGGGVPDGRYLAIACPGCATRVWDTTRDHLLTELPPVTAPSPDAPVTFPAVSASGNRAAIACGTAANVYELPAGRLVRSIEHTAPVTALAFGPGGELVSGDAGGVVLMARAGQVPVAIAPAVGTGIDAIAVLSPARIGTADTAGRVRILGGDGAAIAAFDTGAGTRILRPSPDGRRLLVVPFHAGKAAPMTLVTVDQSTTTHLDGPPVYAARWVDGGRAILSAHADGAARLWSSDGTLLRTYIGGTRFLADADMSPDGMLVVGGGGDGLLRFWDTTTGQPLWVAPAHRPYVMGLHFEDGDLITRGIGGEVARWRWPSPDAVIRGAASPLH